MQSTFDEPSINGLDMLSSFYSSPLNLDGGSIQDTETLIDIYTGNMMENKDDIEKLLEAQKHLRENGDDLAVDSENTVPDENDELLTKIKEYCEKALDKLKDEILRFNNKKDSLQEKVSFCEYIMFTQRENNTRLKNILISPLITHTDDQTKACDDIIAKSDIYFKDILQMLNSDITNIRKDVSNAKKNIRNLLKALSLSKSLSNATLQCPICMNSQVTLFCDPCGHTYCSKCLKSTDCYICRTKVKKMNSLFFN